MRLAVTVFNGHIPNSVVIRKAFLFEKDIGMVYDVKSFCVLEDSNGLFTIHVVLDNKLIELKHITSYREPGQDPVASPLYNKFYLDHLEAIYLAKEWGLYFFDEPYNPPNPMFNAHLSVKEWDRKVKEYDDGYESRKGENSSARNAQSINEVCRAVLEEIDIPDIDVDFNYLEDHLNHLKEQL